MELINTEEEIASMRSRDPVKLKCIVCKTEFTLLKHRFLDCKKHGGLHGSYCSIKCRNVNKTKHQVLQCDLCNATFSRREKEIKKSNKHFCSNKCSATYWNAIKYPIKDIPSPPKISKKVECICGTCSKIFYRYVSNMQPNKCGLRFCSRTCQAIHANKTWNKSPRFGINKSRCETILKNIILTAFPSIIIKENDRTIIPNSLELDLYFPEKKVAIELNGPCHYIPMFGSDELNKTQSKDLLKIKYCQENNIKLFIINVMGVKNQKQMLLDVFQIQLRSHLL
jgi:hypothetical protein